MVSMIGFIRSHSTAARKPVKMMMTITGLWENLRYFYNPGIAEVLACL